MVNLLKKDYLKKILFCHLKRHLKYGPFNPPQNNYFLRSGQAARTQTSRDSDLWSGCLKKIDEKLSIKKGAVRYKCWNYNGDLPWNTTQKTQKTQSLDKFRVEIFFQLVVVFPN